MTKDLKYWVYLNYFPKFGPIRFKKIIKNFDNMENAFNAHYKELISAGIEENIVMEFIAFKNKMELTPDQIMENLEKENIKVITIKNNLYPNLLKEIYNPPPVLYYKGNIDLNNEFSIAVVGTRKYTNYGQEVTEHIVKDLARNNLTIISGMAIGIDTLAHLSTFESSGKTIAVLGSGLDKQNIYPATNRYLADRIILNKGGIISEFPPGTPPLKHHFPQRNRIISGLSLGTLVIEAGKKSGALITANYALEQNREVFAVPGNIYADNSQGPNNLIKMGAKTVTCAEDIMETLNLAHATSYIKNKKIIPESEEEKIIISFLSYDPAHIDDLILLTKLDTSTINSTLIIMEMKGMIKNLGGMQYVLSR